MESKYYKCNNIEYEVQIITELSMVDAHYEKILTLGLQLDNEYKNRMLLSVDQGYAYRILKDGKEQGFVYNYVKDFHYYGASIHVHGGAVSILLAMKTMFEINPTAHKLEYAPHTPEQLLMFKSMATGKSIRLFYSSRSTVMFLKKELEQKGIRMFQYLGITEVTI